jgi:hypothetical protein
MPQIGPKLQYNGGKCRQKTAISRGASCDFVSRRKSILWRLLAILRFDHDRPMLQIGPNLHSCGGKSLPRTHAATNRDFDDDMLPGRSLAPIMGLEGGPFVPVSADYGDEAMTYGRPLAPYMGWKGGFL